MVDTREDTSLMRLQRSSNLGLGAPILRYRPTRTRPMRRKFARSASQRPRVELESSQTACLANASYLFFFGYYGMCFTPGPGSALRFSSCAILVRSLVSAHEFAQLLWDLAQVFQEKLLLAFSEPRVAKLS